MKTNNQVVIVIIIILALVGGYFLIKKPNNQEQIPAPITNIENKPAVAGENTFVDQGKTISFSYPNAFALSGGELGYTSTWRTNTQTLGIVIAKVTIPKTTQPQTNLSDSTLTIGTSSDKNAIKNCLVPTNGEISKGKETINSVNFLSQLK